MNANDLIPFFYFGGIAFAFACGLVVVQAVFIEIDMRLGRWLLPMLLPLMTLGIMLGVVLSSRNLKFAAMDIRTIGGAVDGGGGFIRVVTGAILAIAFAKILGRLTKMRTVRSTVREKTSHGLFISFIAYFIATIILPSAFGTKPSFVHNALYPAVLFTAIYVARHEPLAPLISAAKFMLLVMMLGSLALIAVKPDMVMQSNYTGWIPGFKLRLWGLGSNANSIGPLALTLLLLESMQPATSRFLRALMWTAALAVLVLSQSKTVWLAGAVVAAFLACYRFGRDERGGVRVGFIFFAIGGLVVAALALMFVDVEGLIDKLNMTQAGADITTLTGRARVWIVAIHTWQDSPWFGYGLEAWGPLHRMLIGIPFAFHAHNQFLQSLSVAGLFGATSLLVYGWFLVRASWRAAARTRGISLGLMLFVLIRCISETPLDLTGLFIGETLMQALLFMIVVNDSHTKAEAAR